MPSRRFTVTFDCLKSPIRLCFDEISECIIKMTICFDDVSCYTVGTCRYFTILPAYIVSLVHLVPRSSEPRALTAHDARDAPVERVERADGLGEVVAGRKVVGMLVGKNGIV